ncbi:MAG: chemotaxis protein CheW [Desulfuromonadaceae bacterium]
MRTGLLDQLINQVGELFTTRHMLQTVCSEAQDPRLGEGLTQLSRQIADLHRHVLQVRLMPFSTLTGRLPRQLRELERTTGKTIALRIEGGNVELDRAILEALADPLMHLVRNAVDHGIEDNGEIRVSAVREKDLVRIEVRDNGRGFDPEAIRRMAVEKGLLSAEQAQELVDQRLYELVCQPGFSTATTLTETSGRGVGMDVVKAMVEQFGGTLQIDSTFGQGTSIQLDLPLSVAIIQVLLVACAGETLALPLTRILRTLRVSPQELVSSGRSKGIQLEEEFIPLLSLRKVLQLPHAPLAGDLSVVVSELHGRPVGLVVDRLIGQREIFVKSLAFPFDRMGGISGATLLGDGRVIFIIDPLALLEEIATYKPLPEGGKP